MPRLLDLFCGAGGCSVGYARAGFDVVGVDLNTARLKHHPFEHHLADALAYLDAHGHEFDVIHASPPCQEYSITKHTHSNEHPDLLGPTRDALIASGKPWVIENVVGAPMPNAMTLCGTQFGLVADDVDGSPLYLRRHRLFESNVPLMAPGPCRCADYRRRGFKCGGVYGGGSVDRAHAENVRRGGYTPSTGVQQQLMGIDWMPRTHLTQAIPPAYTEFIGEQLMWHLKREAPLAVSA